MEKGNRESKTQRFEMRRKSVHPVNKNKQKKGLTDLFLVEISMKRNRVNRVWMKNQLMQAFLVLVIFGWPSFQKVHKVVHFPLKRNRQIPAICQENQLKLYPIQHFFWLCTISVLVLERAVSVYNSYFWLLMNALSIIYIRFFI